MFGKRISSLWGKITIVLFICCLGGVVLSVNTAVALDGSGTQEDPWRIKSLEDFNDFAADANYWVDYTRLETDVNLAGRTYSTAVIAPDTSSSGGFQGTAFTGVFDGNDHKIINLTIKGSISKKYLGLFGCIDVYSKGKVTNLGLEGGSVTGTSRFVGGLVGYNAGSVTNCYSTGLVNGGEDVGSLIGNNIGNVSNCYSTSSVKGYSRVGGLIGGNFCNVSDCYSDGSVVGDVNIGGLVGGNIGVLSKCYSSCFVIGVDRVGGLVGWDYGSHS